MTPAKGFLTLPNELFDKIFAQVSEADVIRVRKTHRNFQSSARQLILKHVRLPLQPNLAAVDLNILGDFFNAVQNDPSIGDYVHTVQFTHVWHAEAAEASLPLQSGSRQLKLKDVPWIQQGAVQNLLASLPKLDRVVLEIIGYGNPSALEVDFVFLLHKMLQNCTAPITIKSIQPFGIIMTQIAALPNVDTLVVSDTAPETEAGTL
jgi:hypothetical protein